MDLSGAYGRLPLATKAAMIALVGCFALNGLFFGLLSMRLFCLSPSLAMRHFGTQWHRMFTSAFTHANAFHLLINASCLGNYGSHLERDVGSFAFAAMLVVFVALCGSVHVLLGWLMQSRECAVGFSGVLFALIVVDSATNRTQTTRDVLGLFRVNAVAYPFALIVMIQVLIPSSSFVGHLAGICVGSLYVRGTLNFLLCSPATVERFENRYLNNATLESLCSRGYVMSTGNAVRRQHQQWFDVESQQVS